MDIINRETPFTPEEWQALPRNDRGDLTVSDLGMHFLFMSPDLEETLSDDDAARFEDHREEMRVLIHQARQEFGGAL